MVQVCFAEYLQKSVHCWCRCQILTWRFFQWTSKLWRSHVLTDCSLYNRCIKQRHSLYCSTKYFALYHISIWHNIGYKDFEVLDYDFAWTVTLRWRISQLCGYLLAEHITMDLCKLTLDRKLLQLAPGVRIHVKRRRVQSSTCRRPSIIPQLTTRVRR